MRGGEFHEEFCAGAVSIEKAAVRGLVDRSGRYPVLRVPSSDVLAVGTADVRKDLDAQERHGAFIACADVLSGPWATTGMTAEGGPHVAWDWVPGELIVLPDPLMALPALDRLEGFEAGAKRLYRRVLVAALPDGGGEIEAAWTYVG